MDQMNNSKNTLENQNNLNGVKVSPMQAQANPQNTVVPTPMPANPQEVVTPTPIPANPQNNVVNPIPLSNNPVAQNVVTPKQNVINTSKKRSNHIFLFIVIILIALFIYYIDDVLVYFNQNFTPVIRSDIKENASANLIDGYIKINEENAYIKLKGIKFSNVKKNSDNAIFLTYISDRNYSNVGSLSLHIKIYNNEKEQIYNEIFNISGSIEANVSRQYKIILDEEKYNNAYYALITNEGN